ncbi:unnamed protein product [Closterium sp. Yama58-4]|nr:unnamed protein product [Closterium sp. Yama58-4]
MPRRSEELQQVIKEVTSQLGEDEEGGDRVARSADSDEEARGGGQEEGSDGRSAEANEEMNAVTNAERDEEETPPRARENAAEEGEGGGESAEGAERAEGGELAGDAEEKREKTAAAATEEEEEEKAGVGEEKRGNVVPPADDDEVAERKAEKADAAEDDAGEGESARGAEGDGEGEIADETKRQRKSKDDDSEEGEGEGVGDGEGDGEGRRVKKGSHEIPEADDGPRAEKEEDDVEGADDDVSKRTRGRGKERGITGGDDEGEEEEKEGKMRKREIDDENQVQREERAEAAELDGKSDAAADAANTADAGGAGGEEAAGGAGGGAGAAGMEEETEGAAVTPGQDERIPGSGATDRTSTATGAGTDGGSERGSEGGSEPITGAGVGGDVFGRPGEGGTGAGEGSMGTGEGGGMGAPEGGNIVVREGGGMGGVVSEEEMEILKHLQEDVAVRMSEEEQMELEAGAVADADAHSSYMQEVMGLRRNFRPTLMGMKDKASKHVLPHISQIARTSRLAFLKTSSHLTSQITPYFGSSSPLLATLLSYLLLLLPLALVVGLFIRMRAALSLRRIVHLANLYLFLYCFVLLVACFVISAEPMASLKKVAEHNYFVLQLLQGAGYLCYLALQGASLCVTIRSSERGQGKFIRLRAVLQLLVALGVGLHSYITVFERAMLDLPPNASAGAYAAYAACFFFLVLISRGPKRHEDKDK